MIRRRIKKLVTKSCLVMTTAIFIVACGATNPPVVSDGHIQSTSTSKSEDKNAIPSPVTQVPALPRPGKREQLETYTVVVNQVPIRCFRIFR